MVRVRTDHRLSWIKNYGPYSPIRVGWIGFFPNGLDQANQVGRLMLSSDPKILEVLII
jgi:hypothetical protein